MCRSFNARSNGVIGFDTSLIQDQGPEAHSHPDSRTRQGGRAKRAIDMNIRFYAPFKPLDHRRPSGDVVIADGLYRFLVSRGHELKIASRLRTRWIYWKPWRAVSVALERRRLLAKRPQSSTDLWLTYHSYYKGPDVLGPYVTGRQGWPYVIFQGAYATKWRKKWRTRLGYYANRRALLAADHVFANKRVDYHNLKRLLPDKNITYVPPGIYPGEFEFDERSRKEIRSTWNVGDQPVIVSAAMFRAGVKTQSLTWVLKICGMLKQRGRDFRLVLIGDGAQKDRLKKLAGRLLPGRTIFTGRLPREKMYRYYSAGDVFVFPGIGESLGMVYLEAQSCRLPVVAFDSVGVPEVVHKDDTGFLTPAQDTDAYVEAVDRLLQNVELRSEMGRAAAAYVRQQHDLQINYRGVENRLLEIVSTPADR